MRVVTDSSEYCASDVCKVDAAEWQTLCAVMESHSRIERMCIQAQQQVVNAVTSDTVAVQDVLEVALGGMPLTTTVEGLERDAINLRYSRDFRENIEVLRAIAQACE